MREIDVPRVRRNVRAFGLVAEVAQVALVDHILVIGLGDTVDFHRLRCVDEVEQCRECVAQADAAPAPVADTEDAFELLVDGGLVVELRVFPVERVARRCVEAAFARGAFLVRHVDDPCARAGGPRIPNRFVILAKAGTQSLEVTGSRLSPG